jgi:hypothetical protein
MPTKPIDYSNVSFYKLCCNDPSITDIYVGHTTNFTKRKNLHKDRCNNKNNTGYNTYVYNFIRDNGGFENWSMIELCNKPCENKRDAERIERQYIEDLSASLNKRIPTKTKKEYREEHREEAHEYHKIYYKENRETLKTYHTDYHNKNREEIIQQKRIYNKEHKDEMYKKNKQYRELHKEELKEKNKQYYEKHKEAINERRRLQSKIKSTTDQKEDV